MYLLWFDDDKHRPVDEKIRHACDAYADRFHRPPSLVLTNDAECVSIPGILVRARDYIRPSHYWIGEEA